MDTQVEISFTQDKTIKQFLVPLEKFDRDGGPNFNDCSELFEHPPPQICSLPLLELL